jgi:CelD/BcsL family acetyltransferase involved in cellulose biosynthesis
MTAPPSTQQLEAVELALDDPRWIEFVTSCDEAGPFHHPRWAQTVANCYGFRAFGLAVSRGETIVAGLPVVEVTGHLRRTRWLSLPFTDYCAPLRFEDNGAFAAVERARKDAAVARFDIRAPAYSVPGEPIGFRHLLPLGGDPSAVFATFGKSSVQRRVRKSEENRLVDVRRAECDADLVEIFYRLHLETRRRLGVPVQPKRFFRALWHGMLEPGLGFALVGYSGDRPIAGAVFLAWNRTVVYKFGASLRPYQRLHPNHVLLWHAIRSACLEGYETFDFGRTEFDAEGLRAFKLAWGTTEEPLVYSVLGDIVQRTSSGTATRTLASVLRHSPAWVCRATGELLYKYAA